MRQRISGGGRERGREIEGERKRIGERDKKTERASVVNPDSSISPRDAGDTQQPPDRQERGRNAGLYTFSFL